MLVVGLKYGGNVVMARQGGILSVVDGTNKLVLDININTTYVPYPKYFGMELGRVAKGQERQPGINAGQVTFAGETRRNHEP